MGSLDDTAHPSATTTGSIDEAARLRALQAYEVLDTPREEAFDTLVTLAASYCDTSTAAISLLDENRQWFKAEIGFGMREMARDQSICGITYLQPGLTVIRDLDIDPRFAGFPSLVAGNRFYAGVRLDTPDGLPLGTLCVLDTVPRPDGLSSAQAFALTAMAREVMDQLESRRALREGDFEVRHRRSIEQALRYSREQLDAIVNEAGIGIAQLDVFGRFLLVNDRLCSITGRSREMLLDVRLRDIADRADFRHSARAYLAMLASGDPVRLEARIMLPDGGMTLVETTFTPAGPAGSDRVVIAVVQDVTEQREAERALRQSEARFRGAVEATSGVLWTSDSDARMSGAQPGWAALTGQTEPELHGFGWTTTVHPDDRRPTRRAWLQAVAAHVPFVFEHRVRRADGLWRLFAVRAVPAIDDAGEVREWIGVHTDITEPRMTETALQRLNERLEGEVEARTRERDRIWQVSRELIAICGFDGMMLHANPAWTSLLGWSQSMVRMVPMIRFIHAEERTALAAVIGSLAARPGSRQIETRVLAADGTSHRIAWSATSDDVAIYAVGRDVTAEREADEALRRTEDQLRQSQKMEAVGQLTGGIAHDFNNLLTAIVGSLELAQARFVSGRTTDLDRLMGNAMTAATRAGALTHRLLAFARRQTLDPSRLDLRELVTSMHSLFVGTMGEDIAVHVDLPPRLWPVLCDANQLENALLNLAINARDAMPDGGTFTLAANNRALGVQDAADHGDLPAGDYVAITVTDTGTGISAELRERVFEPFFTTKPLGQGTGLGLSQLYGFVKQSNGHVQLDSTVGLGTRFTLWLPRAAEEHGFGEDATSDPDRAADPIGGTVLVVEDEAAVRGLIVEVLEGVGLRALQAADGPEGLEAIEHGGRIDLLITDVGLPGLNGRQLAEMARTRRPDLPVLFITGYAPGPYRRDATEELPQGMEVLGKPFTLQALRDRIGAMLLARQAA